VPQTRNPLFVAAARGKATTLSIVGIQKLANFARRKALFRHLIGRSKPYATSLVVFKGRRTKSLPQSNNELRGAWREDYLK
jgi:hypothetical protein